jgi:hypothetical protein
MKTFSFTQLKKIAADQGYKFASLQNDQGDKLQLNNTVKTKINPQLDLLKKRLDGELYNDGIYYVCMAQTIARAANPDKFAVVKGKITKELSEQVNKKDQKEVIKLSPSVDVLSYDQALAMQQTISDLKAEVQMLELEIEFKDQEIEELKEQVKEGGLDEDGKTPLNGIKSFVEETMPSITGIMDKYFANQDRKLDIEEKKLSMGKTSNTFAKKKDQKRTLIKPGDPEHIALIHALHKQDTDESWEKLQRELDKLEAVNHDLYVQVCKELNIEFEE